ncbi:G2/mitotic-specific cyclin [Mortierella sp. AM989]|nr:G2/mitotic-specific cyclin [Mortierella sp. AM989]
MESFSSQSALDLIYTNQTILNNASHPSGDIIGARSNLQLSSPPNSSSSSSPSPSTDISNCSPSFINSLTTSSPTRRRPQSLLSGTRRLDLSREMERARYNFNGNRSPHDPFHPSPPFKIFDDGDDGQPLQEPDTSCLVGDTSKRRAEKSPSRIQKTSMQGRMRSASMIVLPPRTRHQQQPHNYYGVAGNNLQQDLNAREPEPTLSSQPLELPPSGKNTPSTDPFWFDKSEDPSDSVSNKRLRNEPRGKEGRSARTAPLSSKRPPLLRRSTNSMIADLSIGSYSDKTSGDTQEHKDHEGSHISIASDTDTVVCEEGIVESIEPQTLVTRKAPRRTPLSDISSVADIDTSLTICIESAELREPIEPISLIQTLPLGPLMTRPRKGSTRQRLRIVNPFPMNPSYWNEYANDTLDYLLEIEGRYDRFMYMSPESDLGHNRMTLVAWLIEISYGLFGLQSATLHSAVNILDRYLSIRKEDPVQLDRLQGVGLCSLMIASATGFSDYFKRAIPDNYSVMELTDIAASALWIALCTVHQDWSEELAISTGYTRTDMTPCSMIFKELVCAPTDTQELQRAFHYKYQFEKAFASLITVLQ